MSRPTDAGRVLRRALTLTSLACCLLVVMSFALFTHDQIAGASARQQNEIASGAAVVPSGVPSGDRHGQPRRFIDGAAKSLTSPYASIAHSNSPWVERGVPAVVALIVYGVGLRFVARFSSGRP